jgi:hypothetical protein
MNWIGLLQDRKPHWTFVVQQRTDHLHQHKRSAQIIQASTILQPNLLTNSDMTENFRRKVSATTFFNKRSIIWDVMVCSTLKINQCFGRTCRLHLQGRRIRQALFATCFMLVSCFTYYIEDRTLHNHSCANIKSYILFNSLWNNCNSARYLLYDTYTLPYWLRHK